MLGETAEVGSERVTARGALRLHSSESMALARYFAAQPAMWEIEMFPRTVAHIEVIHFDGVVDLSAHPHLQNADAPLTWRQSSHADPRAGFSRENWSVVIKLSRRAPDPRGTVRREERISIHSGVRCRETTKIRGCS